MTLALSTITIDCRDALSVSRFWAAALDLPIGEGADADYATVGDAGGTGPTMAFVRVPEHKTVKNRVHVDLHADDREAEVARLIGLGAHRLADHDEQGESWTTLLDVEGNELCIA